MMDKTCEDITYTKKRGGKDEHKLWRYDYTVIQIRYKCVFMNNVIFLLECRHAFVGDASEWIFRCDSNEMTVEA